MQITLSLQGNDEFLNKLGSMQSALQRDVLQESINSVAESTRDAIRKSIIESYRLDFSEVDGSMRLRKAGGNQMVATISIWGSPRKRGRAMNVIRFYERQSTAGILRRSGLFGTATREDERLREAHALKMKIRQLNFLIKRGGTLKSINGAFIGNSGRTVFRRVGKSRFPIEAVSTIGVGQMFSSRSIRDRVLGQAKLDLKNAIERRLISSQGGAHFSQVAMRQIGYQLVDSTRFMNDSPTIRFFQKKLARYAQNQWRDLGHDVGNAIFGY